MKNLKLIIVLFAFASICFGGTLLSAPITRANIVDDQAEYPAFNAPTVNIQLFRNGAPFDPQGAGDALTGPLYQRQYFSGDSDFFVPDDATYLFNIDELTGARTWILPDIGSFSTMGDSLNRCLTVGDAVGGINLTNTITLIGQNEQLINESLDYVLELAYRRVKLCPLKMFSRWFVVGE